MTKSTITRTWIGGLATFAGGILVSLAGVFLMLGYGGTFTQVAGTNNYDFTPDMNGFFWSTVGVIVVGGTIALVGGIVQLVAWIGGLFNSYLLPSKTWFMVLLLGGLCSILLGLGPVGLAVMVAYLIAAPDGTPYRTPAVPVMAQQAGPLAPTT